MAAEGHGTRAIIAAFFANLGIAIAKFVGFFFTGSSSMLAEAIHSCADTGNQALLILGMRQAKRIPTPSHPFGYGRERYFWSFIVALVLFSLGSLFAFYEAIHKLQHPEPIDAPGWAFGILGVAIVLEAFSLRTAVVEANHARAGASMVGFIRRSKAPELPVVLLEDIGAMLGLLVALGAVTLSVVTDDGVWDGVGTLVIGALLGIIAIILAFEMKSLLIGESAGKDHDRAIREALAQAPAVTRVIHMRTQHLGPDELLVAAKVAFQADLSFEELADAINDIEDRVRAAVPIARPMYIEPDVYRPGNGNEILPSRNADAGPDGAS